MGNREYIPRPRSHVFVDFHSFYASLKNNLIYIMLNPLRKKKVRVYTIPLGWQTLDSHNVIKVLFYCVSVISGGYHHFTLLSSSNQKSIFLYFILHCEINF